MSTPEDSRQLAIQQILKKAERKNLKLGLASKLEGGPNASGPVDDADDADDQREGGDSGSP